MLLEHRGADLLRDRIRRLLRNLPRAIPGEEEPVHQIRVASRRLRVAIPILVHRPGRKSVRRLRRHLRELIRTAGSSRDLDVCVLLFDKHFQSAGGLAPEAAILRRRLVAARGRSRHSMAEDLLDLDLARLRQGLKTIAAETPEELFMVMSRFRRSRDSVGTRTITDLQDLGDRFDPVLLHAVRRRVRRLRYIAEVGGVFREEASGAPKKFKALQESLGKIHDAYILALRLERHAATASRLGQDRVASTGRELAAGFMDLSRELHSAFLLRGPLDEIKQALALMGRSATAA